MKLKLIEKNSPTDRVPMYYEAGTIDLALKTQESFNKAVGYMEKELGYKPDARLVFLGASDWDKITNYPYGTPYVSTDKPHVILLPKDLNGSLTQVTLALKNKLGEKTLKEFKDAGVTFEEAANKLVYWVGLHELGHLYPIDQKQTLPTAWFSEMYASYFAYSVLRETDPQAAREWDLVLDAYDAHTPQHKTLDKFETVFTNMDYTDYVWFQAQFNDINRVVYAKLKLAGFVHKVDAALAEQPVADREAFLARLEQITPGFLRWAENLGQ